MEQHAEQQRTLADIFLADLERDAAATRRTLERVPEGRNDWKPHEKSMRLGYLAALVAHMPSWIELMIDRDELDLGAPESRKFRAQEASSTAALLKSLEDSLAGARRALKGATEEHLMKPWRFLVNGNVVAEQPRHIMIRDSVLNHLAHHRGQLTVYLRLTGALVPAIYGPSADER